MAAEFLPTFMYCLGSGNFDVVQTALRNLPEYVLLCQGIQTEDDFIIRNHDNCFCLMLLYKLLIHFFAFVKLILQFQNNLMG